MKQLQLAGANTQEADMPRVSFMTEFPASPMQVSDLKERISELRHDKRFRHSLVVFAEEEVETEPPYPTWTSIGFDVHVPPRELLRADAQLHQEAWQELQVALDMAKGWCKRVGLDLLIYFEEHEICELVGCVGPVTSDTELLRMSLHPTIE